MDSYIDWNNNFAWNQEPYENFNVYQENQFFPIYQNPYLDSYSYPYSYLEPQYAQEFLNKEKERFDTLEKNMETLMKSQIQTNQAISRLEIQLSQLVTIINEQEMSEFEFNLENHNGSENDEKNKNLVFNSSKFESSQFEESNNYEYMPKIDHVTINESVEKVYKPKTIYPERLISIKQPNDFVDQPIKINMIQELSMTQVMNDNKLMVVDNPIDFFFNHLDQNWDEFKYLDKVNELLRSTTHESTKLEHENEPIVSCFENVSESFLEVDSKHNCDEKSNYFQFLRPPENHDNFTLVFSFASLFY